MGLNLTSLNHIKRRPGKLQKNCSIATSYPQILAVQQRKLNIVLSNVTAKKWCSIRHTLADFTETSAASTQWSHTQNADHTEKSTRTHRICSMGIASLPTNVECFSALFTRKLLLLHKVYCTQLEVLTD